MGMRFAVRMYSFMREIDLSASTHGGGGLV